MFNKNKKKNKKKIKYGNKIEERNNKINLKKENLVGSEKVEYDNINKNNISQYLDYSKDKYDCDKNKNNLNNPIDINKSKFKNSNDYLNSFYESEDSVEKLTNDYILNNSWGIDVDSKNSLIPKYRIQKSNFSNDEKLLLNELRNDLVNLAVSDNNIQLTNKILLEDIFQFLKKRFESFDLANIDSEAIIQKTYDYTDDCTDKNQNNSLINLDVSDNYMGNNDIDGINNENEILKEDNTKDVGVVYELDESYLFNLAKKFLQELIGFGEIDYLINDDNLEEIMVIGVNKPVFVYHRELGMMETNLIFTEESEIIQIIGLIARETNRRIDQESPILDARLFDGSRVNATISPISADGPSITIRKFKKDPFTIIDLIKFNTLNSELAAFFWLALDGLGVKPANFIVSGGTSSGKTTMLNALSAFINPKERIITIEDTLELQIPHKHLLRMEARSVNIENQGEITIGDLVKNSLRQRPDRIIVGEVRGNEAITLFTALNTGHSGFGTLHANNSRETITRLTNAPMSVPKIMISAIDFIIMEKRIYKSDGFSFRRVTEVDEVVGMEEGTIQLNKLFKWNSENDDFENLAIVSDTLKGIANLKGVSINYLKEEILNRKKILDYLVKKDISNTNELAKFIEKYYIDSKKLFFDLGISI